ncbi:type I restriction endonuclease [Myroides phaeus]|uniref:type I restriction endonuclease n=1 Tax=Myroides phaeus TaxID=702745 RepID=UPI002DB675AA|nr:type I restriction endonuclease [Myroides phaeus]MEC4115946.1 type I restriction endonuclease [Myroides phaeus]
MEFKDSINQFGKRIERLLPQIHTEEATKTSLILPVIRLLGYDVFDPFEVQPEFIADIGIKKGEKVDYAILKDEQPVILIECKHHSENLDPHNSQLFRYFHTTPAKFGLLTNGIEYRFYTDLVTPNKMDEKPFFEFKIDNIRETDINELHKFHKNVFDLESISNTASDLKYFNELKTVIQNEMGNPTEEFVRYFARQVHVGSVTAKVLEQFTVLTKRVFNHVINDQINARLTNALEKQTKESIEIEKPLIEEKPLIVTTQEEIDGYLIVKSIMRQKVNVERVFMRDTQSYCGILLDDNNRKPICRFYFTESKMRLGVFDENKVETKYELSSLDDIYTYSSSLLKMIEVYEE